MKILAVLLVLAAISWALLNSYPHPRGTKNLEITVDPNCVDQGGPSGKGVIKLSPPPKSLNGECKVEGDHPTMCTAVYSQWAIVTLTAIPNPRLGPARQQISNFETFQLARQCSSIGKTCTIAMDDDVQVSVVFCAHVL